MFNIAHLSKFVVNFKLIILSKPKCIVISADLFFVVTRGTSLFYSVFSVNGFGRSWFLVWQLWPLALASQAQANNQSAHLLFLFFYRLLKNPDIRELIRLHQCASCWWPYCAFSPTDNGEMLIKMKSFRRGLVMPNLKNTFLNFLD